MVSTSPRLTVATESARERARALQALPMPDDDATGEPAPRRKRAPVLNLASDIIDGRFVIKDYLGRGALGQVFSATDKQLFGRAVAIKVLTTFEPAIERRLITEAEVLSNVEHSNLVRAIACSTTDQGYRYLAMEFVSGDTLEKHLNRSGWLPWREVLEIGIQLGHVLQALHDAGVIHRDVAPRNVMFDRANSAVKLIDLGAAYLSPEFKETQDSLFSAIPIRHPTLTGCIMGSPRYQPEDARAYTPTPQLDVYALATMLYELCTHGTPRETEYRTIADVVPKNDAPDDFSRALLDAVAPHRDDRTPSAREFALRLQAILDCHPLGPRRAHLFAGSYDRLQTLGATKASVIFRASDRRLSCERVIKVLRREFAKSDPDSLIHFKRSGRILAALNHPNIAQVHHAGDFNGEEFLVMAHCPGQPAEDFSKADQHLDPAEVVEVLRQLASALEACHKIGVIYRDLHSGNVLIERGRKPRVSLFDFDASIVSPEFYAYLRGKYETPPEERIEPSIEIDLSRKPWTAPEVKAGGEYSPASDVYSLGLLCYRLLTGHRPAMANKVGYTPLSDWSEDYPPSFDTLLEQMLLEDPAKRLPLAGIYAALQDIQEEIDDPEIAAGIGARRVGQSPTPITSAEVASATPANEAGLQASEAAAAIVTPAQAPPSVEIVTPADGGLRRACITILGLVLIVGGTWLAAALPQATPEPLNVRREENTLARLAFPDPPPTIPDVVTPSAPPKQETAKPAPTRAAPKSVDSAARKALAGLRACEGAPDVFVAAIHVTGGRGAVASFDGEAVGAADWHACAQERLERVRYPSVDTPAPVRVRLQVR